MGGSWVIENIIMSGIGLIITGIFSLFGLFVVQSGKLGKIDERTKYLVGIVKNLEKRTFMLEERVIVLEKRN